MKKIINTLKQPNIITGYLYSYIHLITEIACFYFLVKVTGNWNFVWLVPFIYDGMAFVPQALIGYVSDKYNKINFSLIGMGLIIISYILYFTFNMNLYFSLIMLCLGNACIHINGAEVTLKTSKGNLSHSAIFVRGYIGYGLPTAWNKTIGQTIILYFTMGIGKALGGILSDSFGIRKTAVISTILAIPFLIFGENLMIVSLIGVMFFSMTMPITLAILVSVLKKTPGLSFGLTTIGLFLGTIPIFFVKITDRLFNFGLITTMSLICCLILLLVLAKEKEAKNEMDI